MNKMNLNLQQGDHIFFTLDGRMVKDPVFLVATSKITNGRVSACVNLPRGMIVTIERGNEIISQGEDA